MTMTMNFDPIKEALGLLGGVLSTLKQVRDMLPDGSQKETATNALNQAERQLGIAEAQVAEGLGYKLCQCTFPPQIMLFTGKEGHYKCPECGYEVTPKLRFG